MDKLNHYYSALFEEAKYFEKFHEVCHYGIFGALIGSVFLDGLVLYLIGLLGLLAQIGLFISRFFSNRSQSLAHQLQRISMLINAYGINNHDFEISQIMGTISLRAHSIAKRKMDERDDSTAYNTPTIDKSASKLRFMIQENAYWNHHLFAICSEKSWKKFYFVIGVVLVILFVGITVTSNMTNDANYSFLRIGLIFLSFLRIWEELEKALIWKNSSEMMLSIDNSLNSILRDQEDSAMLVFSNYNTVKEKTPPIPDKVNYDHSDKLRKGWACRKKEIITQKD